MGKWRCKYEYIHIIYLESEYQIISLCSYWMAHSGSKCFALSIIQYLLTADSAFKHRGSRSLKGMGAGSLPRTLSQ